MGRLNQAFASTFFVGMLFGSFFQHVLVGKFLAIDTKSVGPSKGNVKSLAETEIRNTVHVDDQGRPITKQQLLEPFVIPNLVGFSVATFLPGQTMMPVHEHETMHELFYVIEGTGDFQIDEVVHKVSPGTFLHIAPTEKHGIWVPSDSPDGPLRMVVTGVAVGDKKSK